MMVIKMKILLIEDEPDLGAIIQTSLAHHQYVVDWAQDGKAGWEYLTDNRFRLLRKKLAEFSCEEAIETVRGFGYRLNSAHK